jgi:TatD DNase family protein
MLPPERIMCETDGPYCRNGTRPAEPADVLDVTDALAVTWDTDLQGARQTLTNNARTFEAGKIS